MKVLVCGSRDFANEFLASLLINDRMSRLEPGTIVIHAAARGVDRMAAEAAERFGCDVRSFPADWENLGKQAGVIRNLTMLAEQPDLVIAFWNGLSAGTSHTVMQARKREIPTEVIPL